ncbi:MAG: hypothetical protein E7234_05905 [Lachnospiraceae bacterium]|nr:hypothetical protein [Lachnospiraceae bacterium]
MAEKKYGTIVTDIGNALQAQATITNEKLNLITIAVGDGNGAYYQPSSAMTELKNETWRGPISSVSIKEESPNMVEIKAVLPSEVGGWTIREMAVLDDNENMFAICNTPDIEKVPISTGAAGEIELIMYIVTSNASVLNLVVDPYVLTATKLDIENHNNSFLAHQELFSGLNTGLESHLSRNASDEEGIHGIKIQDGKILYMSDGEWKDSIKEHNTSGMAHTDIRNIISALSGKVGRIEDAIFNNITANPFILTFDNLDGIILTKGVWNRELQRIEC